MTSIRYTCHTCHAGYVPSWAHQRSYLCRCGGALALRTELDDERDRTRALKAELRATKAALEWATTHARRAGDDPEACMRVCRQLATSDDLLQTMRAS